MRRTNLELALGFAGLVFGVAACSDPVTLRGGSVPVEPLQLMDLIVRNGTGGRIVLRSDPVWIAVGRALDFTVTDGGIVWKLAPEEGSRGGREGERRH